MNKPVTIKIDTKNSEAVINYNNIRKGDTLLVTFKIFQDSQSLNLTGQSMHVALQKSDGFGVEKIINSVTGNTFQVTFSVQATLAVGDVEGIVEISDNSGTNITNSFKFEVKENPASVVVENSKNEIETLQQIKALIDSYNANADNLAIQNQLAIQHESTLTQLNSDSTNLAIRLEEDNADGTATAIRLEADNATGSQLDSNLKNDFAIGNALYNNLQLAIINGNDILSKLPGLNFATIISYIDLMNTMLSGSRLTDGNGNYLTDGNGNYLTIG